MLTSSQLERAGAYNAHQMWHLLTPEHIVTLIHRFQLENGLEADGCAGPKTRARLDEQLHGASVVEFLKHTADVTAFAAAVVEAALGEVGNGEEGGNNSGPHVERYKFMAYDGDTDDDGSWCANLLSYCIVQAEKKLGVKSGIEISGGAKKLFSNIIGAGGTKVSSPRRGDVVLWDRGVPGSWQGHIGLVTHYENDIIRTVEGNVGAFPSVVATFAHDLTKEDKLIGFVRFPL